MFPKRYHLVVLQKFYYLYCNPDCRNLVVQGEHSPPPRELVSKELNHLVAILHVYAGGLNFMK